MLEIQHNRRFYGTIFRAFAPMPAFSGDLSPRVIPDAPLSGNPPHAGQKAPNDFPARWVGLVLSGAVHVIQEDYYGNRSIVSTFQPPQLFGEAFACAGVASLPVSVEAAQDSTLLLLDCQRVIRTCSDACAFHQRLLSNLLHVVAAKNLLLTQKLSFLSKRTTKEKLMAYLMEEARRAGSPTFRLPYDRQGLADYLGVDRSAMSAELSKLRRAGVLDCKGRDVTLHKSTS